MVRQVPKGWMECGGDHHEDTATHTAHDCPADREVWARVAKAWEDATG